MKLKYFLLVVFLLFLAGCTNSSINTLTKDTSESSEVKNKEYVVLFNGITLDKGDQDINVENISNDAVQKLKAKYEVYYYAYGQGEYLGRHKGKVQPRGLDYYWQVAFADQFPEPAIFISEKVNAFPRTITYSSVLNNNTQLYSNIADSIEKQFNVKTIPKQVIEVDLDNCGRNEYIVYSCSADNYPFYVCLTNHEGDIVSYLIAMNNDETVQSYIKKNRELLDLSFSIQKGISIIDYDNDGIMEIIAELPSYEGFAFNVSEYDKGEFQGNYINQCAIIP